MVDARLGSGLTPVAASSVMLVIDPRRISLELDDDNVKARFASPSEARLNESNLCIPARRLGSPSDTLRPGRLWRPSELSDPNANEPIHESRRWRRGLAGTNGADGALSWMLVPGSTSASFV